MVLRYLKLTLTSDRVGLDCCPSAATKMKQERYESGSMHTAIRDTHDDTAVLLVLSSRSRRKHGRSDPMVSLHRRRCQTTGISLYFNRTNGGPGCSSLEGLLQENGVSFRSWVYAVRGLMSVLSLSAGSQVRQRPPQTHSAGRTFPASFSSNNLSGLGSVRAFRLQRYVAQSFI